MKTRLFRSFDEYHDAEVASNYEEADIITENGKISADLMTECKTWKTALRRFFNAVAGIPELAEWKDCLTESCENGYFADAERVWDREKSESVFTGSWAYGVEDHDGAWYVFLVVRKEAS